MRQVLFKLLGLTQDGSKREIEVIENETVLGRGTFLSVSDKRVSRNHAVLVVEDSMVKLKSTHSNPCFVALCSSDRKLALKNGGSVSLSNGDRFSLLPDEHHFEVMISPEQLTDMSVISEKDEIEEDSGIISESKLSDSLEMLKKSRDKDNENNNSSFAHSDTEEKENCTPSNETKRHIPISNKLAALEKPAHNRRVKEPLNENTPSSKVFDTGSLSYQTVVPRQISESKPRRPLTPEIKSTRKEPSMYRQQSVPELSNEDLQSTRANYKRSLKRRKRWVPQWVRDAGTLNPSDVTAARKLPKPIKRPRLGCPHSSKGGADEQVIGSLGERKRSKKPKEQSSSDAQRDSPRDEAYDEESPRLAPIYPESGPPQARDQRKDHSNGNSRPNNNNNWNPRDQQIKQDPSQYNTGFDRQPASRYPDNSKYTQSITRYDAARSNSPPPYNAPDFQRPQSHSKPYRPPSPKQKPPPPPKVKKEDESDEDPEHIVRKKQAHIPRANRKHDYNNKTSSKSHQSLINYMASTMNINAPSSAPKRQLIPANPNKPPAPTVPGRKYSKQSTKPKYRFTPNASREPCMYGRFCYRKNTDHYGDFSHVGDVDYISPNSDDDDKKLECQYGAQCYRKHPLHWRQYRHTVLTNQQKQAAALAQAQNQRASRPGPPAPGPGGPPPPPRNPQRPAEQARTQPPQQQLFVANQDSDENDSGVDKGGQSSPSQRSQPDGPSGQGGQKPKYTKRLYGRFDAYHDPNAQSDGGGGSDFDEGSGNKRAYQEPVPRIKHKKDAPKYRQTNYRHYREDPQSDKQFDVPSPDQEDCWGYY